MVWARLFKPELPIAKHGSFHVGAPSADEAVSAAKRKIDRLLTLI